MPVLSIHWGTIGLFIGAVLSLLIWNEFLVYYVVLLQCMWPGLNVENADKSMPESNGEPLRAMFIADTHLLGTREGHWFDKLRREWQMERAFQTAMSIHSPDVVFVLGDLFDEGKWANEIEFQYYLSRFHKMFRHSDDTELEVVVGNHDIGFHYMVDESRLKRFSRAFTAPSVKLYRKRNVNFILLNSMAFEGDGCDMCQDAQQKLNDVVESLDCAKGDLKGEFCDKHDKFLYTRPIILQHFPMYRESDEGCTGPDSASLSEKSKKFKQKYDCLSEQATDQLLDEVKPRLVISAHTHNFCERELHDGTPEWTIPSYSWRNKRNPSFLLLNLNSNNYGITKCYLPDELTVVYTYIVGGIAIFLYFFFPRAIIYNSRAYSYYKVS